MTTTLQTLGRFGHDANPAIDFDLEVRALNRRLEGAVFGLLPAGSQQPERVEVVSDAIDNALKFNVGGDLRAVSAKNDLRSLRARADYAMARTRPVQHEVDANDQLLRLRAYFSRIESRVEGPDGSATNGAQACEQIKGLLEQLIDDARGLRSLPSFTNAAPVPSERG